MNRWMIILLLAAVLVALWRLRRTYSGIKPDREQEIREKLEELRKKRDE